MQKTFSILIIFLASEIIISGMQPIFAAPPKYNPPQDSELTPLIETNNHFGTSNNRTIKDLASIPTSTIRSRAAIKKMMAAAHHPSRILVRFQDGTPATAIRSAHDQVHGCQALKSFHCVPHLELVAVPPGGVATALANYLKRPDVLYAEPDYEVHATATPNDTDLSMLWGLVNNGQVINGVPGTPGADINATQAWDAWTGDPNFRIGVIDSGIDYTHPDIAANIWVNPGEIPGNLIDDDLNGFIDDVHGYDFANNDGDPIDDNGHGTHVSGTIGAVGNNGLGVVGVNWSCKLVALKFLGSTGSGSTSDAIRAIQYMIDLNIKVSNNSWGSSAFSQSLYDAVESLQIVDHLFIAAAGNANANIETFPHFPSGFDLPNIISVAAVNNQNLKAGFSNFGPISVDLGAPGVDIFSTFAGSQYAFLSGTSMATPHVTGVVALLRGKTPTMQGSQVKARILDSSRPTVSMANITVSGGVLNAFAAVDDCNDNGLSDLLEIAGGMVADCTGNGIPDICEPDCNGNGVADSCDIATSFSMDCTSNGIPDECDPDCDNDGLADLCTIAQGLDTDCNNNNIPDACDPDCNGNGVTDECDIDVGFSQDCTNNGIPDECDPDCDNDGTADLCSIATGIDKDCNTNGVPDNCDLTSGLSQDCDSNGIPDECEQDCNDNGILDACDIATGSSIDCTSNGVPDECELDCNENGEADSCEIAAGTLPDTDGNGVADECVLGFFLVPVDATGPHTITGNEIQLDAGGQQVKLEVQMVGWDPTQSGTPVLRAYQAALDPTSFASGIGAPLQLARTPCTIDAECPNGFFSPGLCVNGLCDDQSAFVVDELHPRYVFRGLDAIVSTFPNQNLPTAAGAVVPDKADAVRDSIVKKYGLTISVDVPVDAEGRYVVEFMSVDPPSFTFWLDPTSAIIASPALVPAVIVLPSDCNNNGIEDAQDIINGTSQDCNINGIPDDCIAIEVDCNANGVPDACDITQGTSLDANGNGVPDECEPAILFVNATAMGTNNGASWTDAFTSLGDALTVAESSNGFVQQIWVTAGTYKPTSQTIFGNDRSQAFSMISGVALYGGFAGNETDLSQRDIVTNETILSGDLNGDDGPNETGTAENSYHVVVADGVDTTAILDGFTITAGNANGFAGTQSDKGGGLLVNVGGATLSACSFVSNQAALGGGIAVRGSTLTMSKCLILNNQAPIIGGLYVLGPASSVTADATSFIGNVSQISGSATFFCNTADATFRNCLFSGNVINSIDGNGAAINACFNTTITLINSTVVNNNSPTWPAGLNLGVADSTIINTIVWGNRSGNSPTIEKDQLSIPSTTSSATRVIEHNGIEGWTGDLGGIGNTGGNPVFADADGIDNTVGTLDDDLHLLADSACIDIGDNNALPAGITLDLDGNPRMVGISIDAGAYENQMPPDCAALNNCSSNGTCIADNVCQCDTGYSGADCSLFFCDNVNNCSGQGVCIGPDTCQCDPGFTGADCSMLSCVNVNDCSGQGTCIAPDVCQCNLGFSGADCSLFFCDNVNNCSGLGTCIAPDTCLCDQGFAGADCSSFSCENMNNCSGHGSCIAIDVCQCEPGFEGQDCSIAPPVPAISTWGLVILTILTTLAATVIIRRNETNNPHRMSY